jgi:hypothetical protein
MSISRVPSARCDGCRSAIQSHENFVLAQSIASVIGRNNRLLVQYTSLLYGGRIIRFSKSKSYQEFP